MAFQRRFALTVLTCIAATATAPAAAPTYTPAQAENLVKSAVVFAKKNGMAKLIEETNREGGLFHVGSGGELYIFIYDQQAVVKAIGYNTAALVGKNRMDIQDSDGKFFLKEILNTANTQGKGWVDYRYPNPATNQVERKISYVERVDGLVIGSGIYKN